MICYGYNSYNHNHHYVYNGYITIIITIHYGSSTMISLTDPRINFKYTDWPKYDGTSNEKFTVIHRNSAELRCHHISVRLYYLLRLLKINHFFRELTFPLSDHDITNSSWLFSVLYSFICRIIMRFVLFFFWQFRPQFTLNPLLFRDLTVSPRWIRKIHYETTIFCG